MSGGFTRLSNGFRITGSSLQSSSVSGRLHVTDDNDPMEEDWDLSRTQRSEEVDLFDEGTAVHSGSSGSGGSAGQKADSSDGTCGPGTRTSRSSNLTGWAVTGCGSFLPAGAKSLLSEDHLAHQDLVFLAVLDFLCECGSVRPVHGLLFNPQEVRNRLMLLLKQVDFSKALHLNMVGVICGEATEQLSVCLSV